MAPLPLSALNDFLYGPRRAWLKFVEGLRSANEHTLLGDLAHEHVDFPGYEQRAGWTLLRAFSLFSDKLGLSGKADLLKSGARILRTLGPNGYFHRSAHPSAAILGI